MQTLKAYQEHTSIMKDLNLHSDFAKVREDYQEGFEEIYLKAIDSNVELSNAKEFLGELTRQEIETLQNYTQLAEAVIVEELSDEGAYNLLMHFYEKYDFDNDGITEDGSARNISVIPQNMDSNLKKAFVEAINNSDEDNTISIMLLTLDIEKVKYDLAKQIDIMPSIEKDFIRQNTTFNLANFMEEQLENSPQNKKITFESIQDRVNTILNQDFSQTSAFEFQEKIKSFSQTLKSRYENIKETKIAKTSNQVMLNDLVQNYKNTESVTTETLATILQS